jgi:hemolysin activation/secretion protein
MHSRLSTLITIGGLLAASALQAAPIPDAGSMLREQQPQRPLPKELPESKEKKAEAEKSGDTKRIIVKEFAFSGYEGLATEKQLQSIVADAAGKSISFDELQALAEKITSYLRSRNWLLAKAYLPKQDVSSGLVTFVIIKGKSDGSLSIERDNSVRIRNSTLFRFSENALHPGEPINEKLLERSILLINDLPGLTAKASLEPGSSTGSTAVEMSVLEGPLFSGVLWGDNQGNRYSGSLRSNVMLVVNDPLHFGDQMLGIFTASDRLIQGRFGLNLPLGHRGMRGDFFYTGMHYKLGKDLAPLNFTGGSNIFDAGLLYPLLRTRKNSISSTLTCSYKTLTDAQADKKLHDKVDRSVTLGFTGEHYDKMLGGGNTNWNFGATNGRLHEASDVSISDAAANKTEGKFSRFNLGCARLQHLTERFSLNLSWSMQYALNNLDSSEKFYLGGPNGVRSYPIGEGSGDEGHLFNADIRYSTPVPAFCGTLTLNGFFDAGRITLNKERYPGDVSTATNRNDYWLKGAGAGFSYVYCQKYTFRGTWAHTIGRNSGRSTLGMDSDGRSANNRFWLQTMMYF